MRSGTWIENVRRVVLSDEVICRVRAAAMGRVRILANIAKIAKIANIEIRSAWTDRMNFGNSGNVGNVGNVKPVPQPLEPVI